MTAAGDPVVLEDDDEDDALLIDEDEDEDTEDRPVRASNKVKKKDLKRTPAHLRPPVYDFSPNSPDGPFGMTGYKSPAKELSRIGSLSMKESDGFLDEFFDNLLDKNAKFNNEVRSIIKNLGTKISNNTSVILNESLEDEDK